MDDQMQCVEVAVVQCQRNVIGYLFAKFRDLELAKDEAQRAFLALAQYDCPSIENKQAWLITVSFRNTLRTVNRSRRQESLNADAWSEVPDQKTASPAEAAAMSERHSQILAHLDALTEKQREVVSLIYFGGMKPGQVAELLGDKPNNIHAVHFAALATLRKRFRGGLN